MPARLDYYAHIPPPENYVPRPELLTELRSAILADTHAVALTSAVRARPYALHGMGGIGKTVAARALCDDDVVQAAFPDGILWATVGQSPDLGAQLRDWVERLGGFVTHPAPTLNSLKNTLAALLQDRVCLLIADDVWRKQDLEPFRIRGPRCQLLFTTRDAEMARELGASVKPVPLMTVDEAVQLLDEWSAPHLAATPRTLKEQIVERLGRLPLAIRLAGAQLRRQAPMKWLKAFDFRTLRSSRPETVHDNLEATFELSLSFLRPDDRDLYVALAVFPPDEPIHPAGIAQLWRALSNLMAHDSEALLDDLASCALLERASDSAAQTVSLHDLLVDFITVRLGAKAPALHQALLDAYRLSTEDGRWSTLPNDGYVHAHLTYHMEHAGRIDDIHALLREETPAGRHAWFEVQDRLGQGAALLVDVDRAWRLAEGTRSMPLQVRYALLWASVHSLAANIPLVLLTDLVRLDYWPLDQALAYARQTAPVARVPALVAFARMVKGELATKLLEEGLAVAMQIGDMQERSEAVARMAGALVEHGRLDEAAAIARRIEDPERRATALRAVALRLQGNLRATLLTEAAASARVIEDHAARVEALRAVARAMADLSHFDMAQALVDEIEDVTYRSRTRGVVAAALAKQGRLDEALAMAPVIENSSSRGQLLRIVVETLAGQGRVDEALATARQIDDVWHRAWALGIVAARLEDERGPVVLDEALTVAGQLTDIGERAEVLERVTEVAAEQGHVDDALSIARTIDDSWSRARALQAIAGQSEGEQFLALLNEALTAARTIEEVRLRDTALPAIVGALANQGRLNEALAAAREIEDALTRTRALAAVTRRLDHERQVSVVEEALAATRTLEDAEPRVEALRALAACLHGASQAELLDEAVAVTRRVHDAPWRVTVLTAAAEHLPSERSAGVLSDALNVAQFIGNARRRDKALSEVAAGLVAQGMIAEALNAASHIVDGWHRAEVVGGVAQALASKGQLDEALTLARTIEESWLHAKALSVVAGVLARHGRLDEAQAVARSIDEDWPRHEALAALALALAEHDRLDEALTVAHEIGDARSRSAALQSIAQSVGSEQRPEVLDQAVAAARRVEAPWSRARALAAIVSCLGGEQGAMVLDEAMVVAREIEDASARAVALRAVAEVSTSERAAALLDEALAAVHSIREVWSRGPALRALAAALAERRQLDQALSVAGEIESPQYRAETLAVVAHWLPAERRTAVLDEAVTTACEIEDRSSRAGALRVVASVLVENRHLDVLPTTLHRLASRTRADLLSDLTALMPAVAVLAGPAELVEITRAIVDVGRWWP